MLTTEQKPQHLLEKIKRILMFLKVFHLYIFIKLNIYIYESNDTTHIYIIYTCTSLTQPNQSFKHFEKPQAKILS